MPKPSAGLLLYRFDDHGDPEILLVHPGGPFRVRRDQGVWSVPKGELEPGDAPEEAAEREFAEELGRPAPPGARLDLGEIQQSGGKHVRVWAVRGELDADRVRSNTFEMEWPPRSGRRQRFPEVDRARWVGVDEARRLLVPAQVELLDRLLAQHVDRT